MIKSDRYPFIYFFSLFDRFSDHLTAGITGREGGVSPSPWNSFNTALHCGDDSEAVKENRRRLCSALGTDPSAYTCGEQIHDCKGRIVRQGERGSGAFSCESSLRGTDALLTDRTGILLNIHVADCVPLILYDSVKRAGALVHAGWKGTAANIAKRTVSRMVSEFASDPKDIFGAMGPSIGPCCFEIGEDTAERLTTGFPYRNEIVTRRNHRIFGNLWKANEEQLLQSGLKKENMESAGICTCCHHDEFFSYRAEAGNTGRFSAFLLLK